MQARHRAHDRCRPPDDGTGAIVSILLAFSRRLGNRGWHGNKFVGMAAIGTKRTCTNQRLMSAFGGKADIGEPCSSASIFEYAFPRLTPPPGDNPTAALRRTHATKHRPGGGPCKALLDSCSAPSIRASTSLFRSPCAARIRQCNKINQPTYPRYAADTCPSIGIVSHETRRALYFCQPLAPIFNPPGQPGYGDKWPS